MDQTRIGKFIAQRRKEQGYTQRTLAELLGISDKTVSKWETGNGLPEVSLMLPLCEALHISVNELLTGDHVTDADYKKKAEENMMNLIAKEREENKKKMVLSVAIGIIGLISFLTILLTVVTYTDEISTPVKGILIVIACCVFAASMYFAMEGDRTIGYFKCKHCGGTFVPGFGAYSLGVHIVTTRHLKCPHCGKRSWCKKVLSKEAE